MISSEKIEKHKRSTGSPVFSIIIPSWNNLPFLQLCIRSILKNSHFKHQLIVHINDGSDGTLAWVKSQPEIDFTYSTSNIGVCYALNAARALLTTEYLVYMNDDMYACPGWDLELHKEIAAVGHNHFFFSSTAIEPVNTGNNAVIVKNYGDDTSRFNEAELLDTFHQLPMHDWQGSTWPPNIVHRDIWDLVGGYSVEFSPGFYSDPDFSMKLWKAGVRLFKGISKSRVYHFGSKSTKRSGKNKGYYTFIKKWGMTSGTFTKAYLRRGLTFDGPLKEPEIPSTGALKNSIKQIEAALRGG
jgi:glycosyltransferase involved in cell wall biosynthesis